MLTEETQAETADDVLAETGDAAAPPADLEAVVGLLTDIRDRLGAAGAEGLRDHEAAALIGVSTRTFWKMNSAEQLPAPLRLSEGRVVWLRGELLNWLNAGAPPRAQWEKVKNRR